MASNPLVGLWRLVSFELRDLDGQASCPFGEAAQGYIIYGENGHMSVNIMAAGRTRFASDDQTAATSEEKIAAADTYISYAGRYSLEDGKVLHHVDVSFFPNWVGTDLIRLFEIKGDLLSLSTPTIRVGGERRTAHLLWERV